MEKCGVGDEKQDRGGVIIISSSYILAISLRSGRDGERGLDY